MNVEPSLNYVTSEIQINCWGMTDTGRARNENQDQFLVAELQKQMAIQSSSVDFQTPSGRTHNCGKLLMVADGMGGMRAGDVASAITIKSTADFLLRSMHWPLFPTTPEFQTFTHDLKKAAAFTDAMVRNSVLAFPQYMGLGSTLTAAYIHWPKLYVLHVGDSRCYLLRNNKIQLLTHDQTLAQQLCDCGKMSSEQAENSSFRHVLSNAIGSDRKLEAMVYQQPLKLGDRLLLCSDGVNQHLSDNELEELLSVDQSPQLTSETIIALVNHRGGLDNSTVVVAAIETPSP